MTIHVNIGEAQTRLSELLNAMKRGERVVIMRAGEPEAEIIPPREVQQTSREERGRKRKAAFGMYRDAIIDPDNALQLSAVNAWEYANLEQRGRFAGAGPLLPLIETLDVQILDLPASVWTAAAELPNVHRDPIDRMMIAHARMLEITLVTADKNVRRYLIKTLW